jgi:protein SCO1
MKIPTRSAIALLSALSLLAAAHAQAPSEERSAASQRYFGDTVMVDQDGHEHRLYTDLLRGKIVIMDFIYTRCVGPCPILSSTFAKLQARLGDRLGKDVFLLSFSVDPGYDTPARLKEYAGRFKAQPGWTFLTGSRENVEAVLRKLGQWVESPEQHQTLYIVGNERTGLWKKAFGLAKPEDLYPVIDSVVDDRGDRGDRGEG